MKPAPGTVVVFFHGRYITNGIEIVDCRQTRIEQVTIHHTLSCGVFGIRSHDVAMVGLDIVADERSGRVFSTIADATHFIGCTGDILFDGCTVSGSGDDFTNVHGCTPLSRRSAQNAPCGSRPRAAIRDSARANGSGRWIRRPCSAAAR